MLARPFLTRPPAKQAAKPVQAMPKEERFLLRVDAQTKRSFASIDDAMAAAKKIKKAYPVVAVTVIDLADGSSRPI